VKQTKKEIIGGRGEFQAWNDIELWIDQEVEG